MFWLFSCLFEQINEPVSLANDGERAIQYNEEKPQAHTTVHRPTLYREQETQNTDNTNSLNPKSKATSSLFLSVMISKLERTLSIALQNKTPQTMEHQ